MRYTVEVALGGGTRQYPRVAAPLPPFTPTGPRLQVHWLDDPNSAGEQPVESSDPPPVFGGALATADITEHKLKTDAFDWYRAGKPLLVSDLADRRIAGLGGGPKEGGNNSGAAQ